MPAHLTRLLAAAALFALPACAQGTMDKADTELTEIVEVGAEAQAAGLITGVDGTRIGDFDMIQGPHGVILTLTIAPGSLEPGWHGLHFHTVGDCSDVGEFKRSGGHVGKIEGGHGLLNPAGPEAGDLPNLWAAADGSAGAQMMTTLVDLQALLDDDGTALIIHANEDDHISQPIGGAGARVGCGVVAVG